MKLYSLICVSIFFLFLATGLDAIASESSGRIFPYHLKPGEKRVCLSLRVLEKKVETALKAKEPIPKDCLNMSGIGFLEGYFVDSSEPKDIILIGVASKNRPCLRLDDLIVGIRGLKSDVSPYCSLDPLPEYVKKLGNLFNKGTNFKSDEEMDTYFQKVKDCVGPQKIRLGGVPVASRLAHVMIDADYHMKKVNQGSVTVPGITSYLDQTLNEEADRIKKGGDLSPGGVNMARFWFHIGRNSPKFLAGDGIVLIDRCEMVLLTEKQNATNSGELVDVAEDDPHATAFAKEMTKSFFPSGSTTVPVYADLENLFRLRTLLLSMDHQSLFSSVDWSYDKYLADYRYKDEKPMPDSMPGLANFKKWKYNYEKDRVLNTYVLFPMVCGGVEMETPVHDTDFGFISPKMMKHLTYVSPVGAKAVGFDFTEPKTLTDLIHGVLSGRDMTARLSWTFPYAVSLENCGGQFSDKPNTVFLGGGMAANLFDEYLNLDEKNRENLPNDLKITFFQNENGHLVQKEVQAGSGWSFFSEHDQILNQLKEKLRDQKAELIPNIESHPDYFQCASSE